jgi:peroxiredoxin
MKSRNASLWAVSVDDLADSQALSQRLKLGFPLATDPQLSVIRQFGVEMDGQPIAVPATFVLRAGDGQIMYRYVGESLFDRPAIKEILRAIDRSSAKETASPP